MENSKFSKMCENTCNMTYLDYRSLSLFRILLGFVGIYRFTLALRWSEEFLASDGFMPIATINNWPTQWSIFYLNHTLFWGQTLCVFGLILSVLLIIGFKTRMVVFLIWILTLGLSARTYLLDCNGHSVYRLMILWSIFLPLDHHFVFFSRQKGEKNFVNSIKFSGLPASIFFIQFILIYFIAGVVKNDSTWAYNGTAVYSALNLGAYVKPLGVLISENHKLTSQLTSMTTIGEMLMPFFLLFDTKRLSIRLLTVVFFVVLQVVFFSTLELGIFPFAMVAYTLAFLPTSFWDYFGCCCKKIDIGQFKIRNKLDFGFKNILISSLFFLAAIDLNSSFTPKLIKLPNWVEQAVFLVRVEQRWRMFVVPEWRDFWIDVEGTREDKSTIDAWSWMRKANDISFSLERPEDIHDVFSEQPWNHYLHNLKNNSLLSEWFLYNLCRKFNSDNATNKIMNLKLHYSYRTILGFDKFSPVTHETLKEWKCE